MKIKEFFDIDYIQYANVDNYQSIASYVDGFKPTARKVFYTYYYHVKKGLIKTSQISSKTAELTNYLYGENSINGVIINLAKDFPGSNNIPIFEKKGHFGDRFFPNSAAAPRYIFVKENPLIKKIFRDEDFPVLHEQIFEGEKIEPRFFVPIIPMLLVNGSEGIGNGFSQKILPRNPKEVLKQLIEFLKEKRKTFNLKPYFVGISYNLVQTDDKSFAFYPDIEFVNESRKKFYYKIKDLVGFSLDKILEKLNSAVDNKVIDSFKDLSDNGKFLFEIVTKKKYSVEELAEKLKLVYKVTENYTCIDEENNIIVFNNVNDLLQKYVSVRLDFYEKRRLYILKQLKEKFEFLKDRYLFLKYYLSGDLKIQKKSKNEIVKQAEKLNIKFTEKHLEMKLYSLTKEKIVELKKDLQNTKDMILYYKKVQPKELWLNELNELKEVLK